MNFAFPSNAGEFTGPNPSDELAIVYYLRERVSDEDMKFEILDMNGKQVAKIVPSKRKGINVLRWNMLLKPPRVATGAQLDYSGFIGPIVPAGEYIMKMTKGKNVYDKKLVLREDPDSPYTPDERELQTKTVMKLFAMQEELADITDTLKKKSDSLNSVHSLLSDTKAAEEILIRVNQLNDLRKSLVASKEGAAITGEEKLREKLSSLYIAVNLFAGKPTDTQLERLKLLESEFNEAKKNAAVLLNKK